MPSLQELCAQLAPQRPTHALEALEPADTPLEALVRSDHDEDRVRRPATRFTGELVREARLRHGLTQRALAEILGLHPAMIASIETGRRGLSPEVIAHLVVLLGLDKCELVAAQRVDSICRSLIAGDTNRVGKKYGLPMSNREGLLLRQALTGVGRDPEVQGPYLDPDQLTKARDTLRAACAHVRSYRPGEYDYARMQLPHWLGRVGTAEDTALILSFVDSKPHEVSRSAVLGLCVLSDRHGTPRQCEYLHRQQSRQMGSYLERLRSNDREAAEINRGFRVLYACDFRQSMPIRFVHGKGLQLPDYRAAAGHCGLRTLKYLAWSLAHDPPMLLGFNMWSLLEGFECANDADRKAFLADDEAKKDIIETLKKTGLTGNKPQNTNGRDILRLQRLLMRGRTRN